jgi:hypothetical protein
MTDPLFARAQLAIEENRELRRQSRAAKTSNDDARQELRRTIFKSKMYISEIRAHRDSRAARDTQE